MGAEKPSMQTDVLNEKKQQLPRLTVRDGLEETGLNVEGGRKGREGVSCYMHILIIQQKTLKL